jgi:hypothetical protein
VGRRFAAVFALLVPLLLQAAPADADGWDPAATVSAYIAAFNMGNVDGALALFDENGSATDLAGHTYTGRAGLTQFLRNNGFGSANARLTTDQLTVVANRAFWDYTCSCTPVPTQVRIVINDQDKISVFAMFPSHAPVRADAASSVPVWLLSGVLLCAIVTGLTLQKRVTTRPLPPRPAQGHLIAALREARTSGVLREPAAHLR